MQKHFNKNFIDLTGRKFGKILVIDHSHSAKSGSRGSHHWWTCICDCGSSELKILGSSLRSGNTISCGCYHKERTSAARFIDLTGKKFGLLTVIEKSCKIKLEFYWKCKCECGNETIVAGVSLRHDKTKSCGCRQGNFVHGMSKNTSEYKKHLLKDPSRKIKHHVGLAVGKVLRRKGKVKGGTTFSKLPYTPQQLKEHLESQWESWMNWDNYGGKNNDPRKTWQIDHIIPQSSFKYDSLEHPDFSKCWALSNLKPLEKIANIKKGKKL